MNTRFGKTLLSIYLACAFLSAAIAQAQVQSGSTGADGDFAPTSNITVDMTSHPDGVYHYRSVTIPESVTVRFKANAKNTPVVWLIQRTCTIRGLIDLSAEGPTPGPGGFAGGNVGSNPTRGEGPGGGGAGGGRGGHRTAGANGPPGHDGVGGTTYGNAFILPLIGGSGGGGGTGEGGPGLGGGGGGAILIVANESVVFGGGQFQGWIEALGGGGSNAGLLAGGGSGGAIRIVATRVTGVGYLRVFPADPGAGQGWIRIDTLGNQFQGFFHPHGTIGYQPIISLPTQPFTIEIASVAGVPISLPTSGRLGSPDAVIASTTSPPVPVVVRCLGLPLNSEITVTAFPSFGSPVSATGFNTQGTLASSTATIQLNLPRGAGSLQAKTTRAISATSTVGEFGAAGLTAEGERFRSVEATATLDGRTEYRYTTEKGKTFVVPGK